MRIGFSFLLKNPQRPGGELRYFLELLNALPKVDGRNDYFVYLLKHEQALLQQLPRSRHLHPRLISSGIRSWHRAIQTHLPKHIEQDRVQLLHATTPILPLRTSCRTVVTIHDAIPLIVPKSTVIPQERRAATLWLRLATRLAHAVIVPSHHTRRELVKRLNIPAWKMSLIPYGFAPLFQPISRAEATQVVQKKFHISPPYLLTVGELVPRKNHRLLFQAFRSVRGHVGRQLTLVIVGKRGWEGHKVLELAQRDPQIRYLGMVSDLELRGLYRAAECLVLPSSHEGFGFPVVEAMACGTPVVAFKQTSLPEVVGNAGLLVEPISALSLAKALEKFLKNPHLSATLRQASLQRAQGFTWERAAQRHLGIYRRALAKED